MNYKYNNFCFAILYTVFIINLTGCDSIISESPTNFTNPFLPISRQIQNDLFDFLEKHISEESAKNNNTYKSNGILVHQAISLYFSEKQISPMKLQTFSLTNGNTYLKRISDSLLTANGFTDMQIKWLNHLLDIYKTSIQENAPLETIKLRLSQFDKQVYVALGYKKAKYLLLTSALLYATLEAALKHSHFSSIKLKLLKNITNFMAL